MGEIMGEIVDTALPHVGMMTLEEFVRRFDQEGPFEIIDGEIVSKMPNVAGQAVTASQLFKKILPFEEKGFTVFIEATFVLLHEPSLVRESHIPDLFIYRSERPHTYYAENTDWQEKPFVLVPDLVIEVVSSNDTYSDIDMRVTRYLEDGVKLVWVVDPQTQKAVVHPAGGAQPVHLALGDKLTGGEIIPGFELPLADLFANP